MSAGAIRAASKVVSSLRGETDAGIAAIIDEEVAPLVDLVNRYRRYHDGEVQCCSADTQSECLCLVCTDSRAALAAWEAK